ncbi:hypothetical protein MHYP_G00342960 [Metynnis hypsauchen]
MESDSYFLPPLPPLPSADARFHVCSNIATPSPSAPQPPIMSCMPLEPRSSQHELHQTGPDYPPTYPPALRARCASGPSQHRAKGRDLSSDPPNPSNLPHIHKAQARIRAGQAGPGRLATQRFGAGGQAVAVTEFWSDDRLEGITADYPAGRIRDCPLKVAQPRGFSTHGQAQGPLPSP